MDNDVYVVLKDMSSYEGEGYSSSSYNELMCIASDFDKARIKMEALAKEDWCNDDVLMLDEDWDFIEFEFKDIFSTYIKYHIRKEKVE